MGTEKPGIGTDLGAELRRRREEAEIRSQQELANRLFCDRTMITKIETGNSVPSDKMLTNWGEVCDFDPAPYIVMAKHARRPEMALRYFDSWLDLEREAKLLRVWSPMLVPGPAQTEDYAIEVFRSFHMDEDTIEGLLAIRLSRHDVYTSRRVMVLLNETVLHSHLVGPPSVMADQFQHILDVSDDLWPSVQLVPSNRVICGMSGGFDIASGESFPETVRMDALEDQISDRRGVVDRAVAKFDLLHSYALSREQSRDLITEAIDQWRKQASANSSVRAVTAIAAAGTVSS